MKLGGLETELENAPTKSSSNQLDKPEPVKVEQNPAEEMINPSAEQKAEAESAPAPQPVSSPKAESPPEED